MSAGDIEGLLRIMARLRDPAGGCPWDVQQTFATIAPYTIEEAYEVADAIDRNDLGDLRDELGDLLLQVVFHARVAQEDPAEPFDLDDVADTLVAKLVRRHPHVFADADAADADAVNRQWDRIKGEEKQRESVLDGVPLALGALARAQKVASRAERSQLDAAAPVPAGDDLGARLLALVQEARATGLDAEGELRRATATWEAGLRAAERAGAPTSA